LRADTAVGRSPMTDIAYNAEARHPVLLAWWARF
jgi:hypothetical protein